MVFFTAKAIVTATVTARATKNRKTKGLKTNNHKGLEPIGNKS